MLKSLIFKWTKMNFILYFFHMHVMYCIVSTLRWTFVDFSINFCDFDFTILFLFAYEDVN